MRVGDLIRGHNPRPQGTEGVNRFAETEYPRFHLATVNITSRNVVEDQVTSDVGGSLLRAEMLPTLLQNDREFEFVIQLLREMLGINYRLIVTDDCVYILKEHNPRHHGMREPGFRSFFMVLAEVTCSVKELSGNDRRLQANFVGRIKNGLPARAGRSAVLQHIVKGFTGSPRLVSPPRNRARMLGGTSASARR